MLDAEGMMLAANVDPSRLRWLLTSRDFIRVRQVKDTTGRYIVQPDATEAGAYRLLGHGVTVTNRVPDTTGGTPTGRAAPVDFSQIAVARDLAPTVAADVAHTYTRGAGFDPITGHPGDDLAAVVLMAAGRIYVDPAHKQQETVDDYTVRYAGFTGWTLPELAVLNTYRRRAA